MFNGILFHVTVVSFCFKRKIKVILEQLLINNGHFRLNILLVIWNRNGFQVYRLVNHSMAVVHRVILKFPDIIWTDIYRELLMAKEKIRLLAQHILLSCAGHRTFVIPVLTLYVYCNYGLEQEYKKENMKKSWDIIVSDPEDSTGYLIADIGNCDESIYTAIQKYGQNINTLYIDHDKLHSVFSTKGISDNLDNILLDTFISIYLQHYASHIENDGKKWRGVLSIFPLTNLTHPRLKSFEEHGPLILITTMNSSQQIANLQCLNIFAEGMIPNNVLDAITLMSNFTELSLMDCSFHSNKMHEILNIYEKRSDNNVIVFTRTIGNLSPSPSLLTKSHMNYIENGMNDVVVLTVSKIKSLTHIIHYEEFNDTVARTFVQSVSKLPLLEVLGIGLVVMSMGDLKTLATVLS
ncbi:hypothetical protein BDC45DRAFT_531801 [Circinella umbellata]|nr:hypothetical protein BDC45DRAFT_531801 [Circinella umbellata]